MITNSEFFFILSYIEKASHYGGRLKDRDADVSLFAPLLHQTGDDDCLAISDSHRRICLPYAQEGKGRFSIWVSLFPCLVGDTGVDVHDDGAIFTDLGGYIEEDTISIVMGEPIWVSCGLGGHRSRNEEDI